METSYLTCVLRPLGFPLIIVQNHTTGGQGTLSCTRSTRNETSTFARSPRASHNILGPTSVCHSPSGEAAVRGIDSRIPSSLPSTLVENQKTSQRSKFSPSFFPEVSGHVVVSTHESVARVQCAECRSGSEKHEGDETDDKFEGTSCDLSTPNNLVQPTQRPKTCLWRVRTFSVNRSLHCFSTIFASCRVFAITPKLSAYTYYA